MDKSIINRITALENKAPSDIVIHAITSSGEIVNEKVRNVIDKDGRIKDGFRGISNESGTIESGTRLKDLDRILAYIKNEAI